MLPQSYTFSHDLCLNDFLRVWLIDNQRYQVSPFRYINWDDGLSHLVRGRKVIWDMKQLMKSVKQTEKAAGTWTEDNWDVKRVNWLYTMVSDRFNFKNKQEV